MSIPSCRALGYSRREIASRLIRAVQYNCVQVMTRRSLEDVPQIRSDEVSLKYRLKLGKSGRMLYEQKDF